MISAMRSLLLKPRSECVAYFSSFSQKDFVKKLRELTLAELKEKKGVDLRTKQDRVVVQMT